MSRNGLIMGIAAVLSGITALMLIVGIVVNPFFLFVALPFGGAAYLMWYQASGKLAERIRANPAGYARATRGDGGPGGFDAGPFQGGRFTRERVRENRRRARGQRTDRQYGRQRARGPGSQPTGLSEAEAADILDVDTGADADEIKTAYREKVKTAHPDAPEGDEDEFKSVKKAYETLGE